MKWFRRIPIGPLAVVVGIISAVAWVTLDGTVPLVISIVAGGSIALRATLGDE
jgi:ApbE superfamily uncharacterized protein (UPF0280 family)